MRKLAKPAPVVGRDTVPGFAQLITRVREARGLSRRDLAARAGVSPTTVSDLESEKKSPSLRVAAALCEVLGILAHVHAPADALNPEFRGESR